MSILNKQNKIRTIFLEATKLYFVNDVGLFEKCGLDDLKMRHNVGCIDEDYVKKVEKYLLDQHFETWQDVADHFVEKATNSGTWHVSFDFGNEYSDNITVAIRFQDYKWNYMATLGFVCKTRIKFPVDGNNFMRIHYTHHKPNKIKVRKYL